MPEGVTDATGPGLTGQTSPTAETPKILHTVYIKLWKERYFPPHMAKIGATTTYVNFGVPGFTRNWKNNNADNVIALRGTSELHQVAELGTCFGYENPLENSKIKYIYKFSSCDSKISGEAFHQDNKQNIFSNGFVYVTTPKRAGEYDLEITFSFSERVNVRVDGLFGANKTATVDTTYKICRKVYVSRVIVPIEKDTTERTKTIGEFNETGIEKAPSGSKKRETAMETYAYDKKHRSAETDIAVYIDKYCFPIEEKNGINFSQGYYGTTSHRGKYTGDTKNCGAIDIGTAEGGVADSSVVLFSLLDGVVVGKGRQYSEEFNGFKSIVQDYYSRYNSTVIKSYIPGFGNIYMAYCHVRRCGYETNSKENVNHRDNLGDGSSRHLAIGQKVEMGMPIGLVGRYNTSNPNGNEEPGTTYILHLHLQIHDHRCLTTDKTEFNDSTVDPLRFFDIDRCAKKDGPTNLVFLGGDYYN